MAYSRIDLIGEKFLLGRASSCNYTVKLADMEDLQSLKAVSKVQCEIIKTSQGPHLKDHSANGKYETDLDKDNINSLLQGLGSTVRKLGRITSGLWSTTP